MDELSMFGKYVYQPLIMIGMILPKPMPGRNVPNPSTLRIEPAHCKATANGNSRDQNLAAS